MSQCAQCGAVVPAEDTFCGRCGCRQTRCTQCGNVVPDQDMFCGKCGHRKVGATGEGGNPFEGLQDPLLNKLQADLDALDAAVQHDKRKLDEPSWPLDGVQWDAGDSSASKRSKWDLSPTPLGQAVPNGYPGHPTLVPPPAAVIPAPGGQVQGYGAPPPQIPVPFKRTICKFHLAGYCKQGPACTFAHGDHEIGQPTPPGSVAPPPALSSPPASSGEMCNFFARAGWCKYGDACKHMHNTGQQLALTQQPAFSEASPFAPPPEGGLSASSDNPFERYVGRLQQASNQGGATTGVAAPPPAVVPPPQWDDQMGGLGGPVSTAPQVVLPPQPQVVVPPPAQMPGTMVAPPPAMVPPPGTLPPAPGGMGNPYDGYKYKTEPCKFFPIGRCMKGDSCTYAHYQTEFQPLPGNAPPPVMVGSGMPKPPPSGEICNFFAKAGWCKYGEACKHMHTGSGAFSSTAIVANGLEGAFPVAAPLPLASGPDAPGYKTRMCSYFAAGSCIKAERCTFAHGQQELAFYIARESEGVSGKAACKFYALGTCTKGEACSFSHGGESGVERQTDVSAAAFGPAAQALALNAMAANGFQTLDSVNLLSQTQPNASLDLI